MYRPEITRPNQSGGDGNGEAVAIDLGPELLPASLGVDQSSQAQHGGRADFLPLGPTAAHPHFDDRFASSLRHTAANGQIRLAPLRILHLLMMVGEVRQR